MLHIDSATAPTLKTTALRKWIRARFLEPTVNALPKTRDVLDFCCGYGFYFDINPNARGVEGDVACVNLLKAKGYDVQLANAREATPYPDREFGWVVAHDVLEHFDYPDLENIFAEIHRILKPGGFFIAIQPNRKGYDYGLTTDTGHRLFVERDHIVRLSEGKFALRREYAEPLPRVMGRFFLHNKEVFWLQKVTG